jgi:hypothetical protein
LDFIVKIIDRSDRNFTEVAANGNVAMLRAESNATGLLVWQELAHGGSCALTGTLRLLDVGNFAHLLALFSL